MKQRGPSRAWKQTLTTTGFTVRFISDIQKHYYPLRRANVAPSSNSDVRPKNFLRADIALTAVLFDAASVTIEALLSGVTVVYIDGKLIDAAKSVIKVLSGRDFRDSRDPRSYGADDGYFVENSFDDQMVIPAIQSGAPLIGIAQDESFLPEYLSIIADRSWELPNLSNAHITVAIEALTGDVVALPAREYLIEDILKVLRPGLSSGRIVADLAALYKDDDALDKAAEDAKAVANGSEEPVVEKPVTPPTIPVGDAATVVVTRLRDLSGYGEAKTWGMQLAADLTEYRDGKLDWADVDKGLLLSGATGTGKTYFAKALAAECEVPLIESSYGDWETKTGSGNLIVKAIKAVFADAKKKAPCIVFIDEIDSIGSRGKRTHNSGWFDVIINGLCGLNEPAPSALEERG